MKTLVLMVNRLRPDFLGCYGSEWLDTPALDRLASESVVFDQHFADMATPAWARRSWRGTHGLCPQRFSKASLAETLSARGVPTALLADAISRTRTTRFGEGWRTCEYIDGPRSPSEKEVGPTLGTLRAAMAWLQAIGNAPDWLLWVELCPLAFPWGSEVFDAEAVEELEDLNREPWFGTPAAARGETLAETDRERVLTTYAGLVCGLDQLIGQLFDFLREEKLYDELLLIATSDVGLSLGEHGRLGDVAPSLYEEQTHLPLVMRLPGGAQAGRRVQQLSQAVDLPYTLLEALAGATPAHAQGKSLLAAACGEGSKLRDYACSRAGLDLWGLQTHQWRLILPRGVGPHGLPAPELYVKPDDRWDMHDVAAAHPDVAEHLELTLRRFRDAVSGGWPEQLPELRQDVLQVVQS
jgi:arylsulfatase A-like enzyme